MRAEDFPEFFKFSKFLQAHFVKSFMPSKDVSVDEFEVDERVESELADANVVSSKVRVSQKVHRPVFDFDFPCLLLDSSTSGHHHLMIMKEVEWDDYKELLVCMAKCGLLEEGYVNASLERGYTSIRVPWVKKVA